MKTKNIIKGIVLVLSVSFMLGGCKGETKNEAKKEGYLKPVQALCEAMQDGEFDLLMDSLGPLKNIMKMVEDDAKNNFNKMIDKYKSKCGEDYKVSYKIKEKSKMEENELKKLESDYSILGSELKLTEGYELKLEITVKGKKGKDKKDLDLSVAKSKDEWCIINFGNTLLE